MEIAKFTKKILLNLNSSSCNKKTTRSIASFYESKTAPILTIKSIKIKPVYTIESLVINEWDESGMTDM